MEENKTDQRSIEVDSHHNFELLDQFYAWSFKNPDLITPVHCAIYSFAIAQCGRFEWKDKFSFPSHVVMEAIGVKTWRTYIRCFNELADWGFFVIYENAKNQYSSNIIGIVEKPVGLKN